MLTKYDPNVDPLSGKQPHEFPIPDLPGYYRPRDPDQRTTYDSLVALLSQGPFKPFPILTLGDIGKEVLYHNKRFLLYDEEKKMYTPGPIPEEILRPFCEAIYAEFIKEENAGKVHASSMVLDALKYTGGAISMIEVAALSKGTIQRLMKGDHTPLGWKPDAVATMMMLHTALEMIGLLGYEAVINFPAQSKTKQHGLEHIAALAKDAGKTIVGIGKDIYVNPHSQRNFIECGSYGLLAYALEAVRVGKPIDQITNMTHNLHEHLTPLFGSYGKELMSSIQDSDTLKNIGKIATLTGAGKEGLSGILAIPGSAPDDAVVTPLQGQVKAVTGALVNNPQRLADMGKNVRSTETLEGRLHAERSEQHAQVFESPFWHDVGAGISHRFADLISLIGTIVNGAVIARHVAKGYTLQGEEAFVYKLASGVYEKEVPR